ncbi:MAG: hypothetical protein LBU98_06270 [Alistipes sp.]|jgi:hypothetical protein|nr:hypothetical protein [Alistipes sp.]
MRGRCFSGVSFVPGDRFADAAGWGRGAGGAIDRIAVAAPSVDDGVSEGSFAPSSADETIAEPSFAPSSADGVPRGPFRSRPAPESVAGTGVPIAPCLPSPLPANAGTKEKGNGPGIEQKKLAGMKSRKFLLQPSVKTTR